MNRFPDFPTDLILSANPPVEEGGVAAETAAPAEHTAPATHEGATETHATTKSPAPLAPPNPIVLEPMSGFMIFCLIAFGVLAAGMLFGLTCYGSKNNYGD